jgi:hypothetical protein
MGFSKPHAGEVWTRLASGIEAGIVGGLAMLGLLVSESLWDGHVWWELPNLLGSTFYGPRAFRSGPSLATLSGMALHFVLTGTLGGLFGLAFGGIHQRGRLILLGMLASIGWYNLANAMFWPSINPWVPAASPRPAGLVSHVLLGACLGYMGVRQKAAAVVPVSDLPVSDPPAVSDPGFPDSSVDAPVYPPEMVEHLATGMAPHIDRGEPPAASSPDAIE